MTSAEIEESAIKFLGIMMTNSQVVSELNNLPDSPEPPGKDPSGVANIVAKTLGLPTKPTPEEVAAMSDHITAATKGLMDKFEQHDQETARVFSPKKFCVF